MKRTVRLNKSEFKGLVKECAVEYFNETAKKLFESSWSRVMQWIDNHDIATISAFREELKDVHDFSKTDIPEGMQIGSVFSTKMNRERSKELQRYLIGLGYGVTKLSESYMEGMGWQNLNKLVRYKTLKGNFPEKDKCVSFVVKRFLDDNKNITLQEEILQECYNDWHRLVNESGVTLSTTDDIKGFARQSIAKYSKI